MDIMHLLGPLFVQNTVLIIIERNDKIMKWTINKGKSIKYIAYASTIKGLKSSHVSVYVYMFLCSWAYIAFK